METEWREDFSQETKRPARSGWSSEARRPGRRMLVSYPLTVGVSKSHRAGVRGCVVVRKRGNSRGAKATQEDGCEMTQRRDYTPTTVPFVATPAGEPPAIEQWANSFVWTDRMLATLRSVNQHSGVRGGKWHTLIDKVWLSAIPVESGS